MNDGYQYPFNKLTEYFIRENHIDVAQSYEIVTVPARDLICAERFDLMAKWIYIDSFEKGMDMSWAREVYKDSINAFSCGKFMEPGTESKNSFQVYLEQFTELIKKIRTDGFDAGISMIPVGEGDCLLDGSHRAAAAAYYNKNVTIIRFPGLTRSYDYRYFRNFLMNDIHMGYMARQYAYLKKNCYFACLWPAAGRLKTEAVTEYIRSAGMIVYEQDVYLTFRGMCTFMAQIYGHQPWTGSIENHFSGVKGKAEACYRKGYPVHTYLFEGENLDQILELKTRIRNIFGLENHSIHISDNDSETKMMADMMYIPNSVAFMNYAEPFRFDMAFRQIQKIKESAFQNHYDLNRFIIDSGSVLEVCGLRAAGDVDFLTDYVETWKEDGMEDHAGQLPYHAINVKDMLYNPENYFYFQKMKFLSVNRVKEMKIRRNEWKDKKDVKLLNSFLKQYRKTPYKYRYETVKKINARLIQYHMYGHGSMSYREYVIWNLKNRFHAFAPSHIRAKFIRGGVKRRRRRLKNKNMSIISSNCNGGVLCSDLGLEFRSPFVNLFIKAGDFIKICSDLKEYLNEELRFVKEEDPVYGMVGYPTAYLKDVKIYFMHYEDENAARDAWNRRKQRINWDNIWIIFTDRSGCTQKDLEAFDKLPYEHKIVFTHLPHPEIKSSFYIKGFENDGKVGILSEYENKRFPAKRVYDQFDFVKWFNEG